MIQTIWYTEACAALGIDNDGTVYAAWNYEAVLADELSFSAGDELKVCRKPDTDTDWWLARKDRREGYVPRNYLAVRKWSISMSF